MAYMKDGVRRYTLKEKIAYHTKCANDGVNVNTGEKLTTVSRIRHANLATKQCNRLNKFMKTGQKFADMKKSYNDKLNSEFDKKEQTKKASAKKNQNSGF